MVDSLVRRVFSLPPFCSSLITSSYLPKYVMYEAKKKMQILFAVNNNTYLCRIIEGIVVVEQNIKEEYCNKNQS